MRCLITGATGFMGGYLVDQLIADGHDVRCLVRDVSKTRRLRGLTAEVANGDLLDPNSLSMAVKGVDCVFHAAAMVSDWGQWSDFETNTVQGTKNILYAAEEAGVSRFLHVSTVDVYDLSAFKTGRLIQEDAPVVYENFDYFYARAKMLAERLVFDCYRRGKMKVSVVRPATLYGPRDRTVLPRLIDFLRDKKAGWVKGYDPVFGLVYVGDVAKLCVLVATSDLAIGKAYNASSAEDVTIKQYSEAICTALGIPMPKRSYPYCLVWALTTLMENWWAVSQRKDMPPLTRVGLRFLTLDQRFSIQKAQELGWHSTTSFAEGMARTTEWIQTV